MANKHYSKPRRWRDQIRKQRSNRRTKKRRSRERQPIINITSLRKHNHSIKAKLLKHRKRSIPACLRRGGNIKKPSDSAAEIVQEIPENTSKMHRRRRLLCLYLFWNLLLPLPLFSLSLFFLSKLQKKHIQKKKNSRRSVCAVGEKQRRGREGNWRACLSSTHNYKAWNYIYAQPTKLWAAILRGKFVKIYLYIYIYIGLFLYRRMTCGPI